LPPNPPLKIDGALQKLLSQADYALGRLFKMIWKNLKEIGYGE